MLAEHSKKIRGTITSPAFELLYFLAKKIRIINTEIQDVSWITTKSCVNNLITGVYAVIVIITNYVDQKLQK